MTEQFKLAPMASTCPARGCDLQAPRHSVFAGSVGVQIPQRWRHANRDQGADEIGFMCECRAAVWLVAAEGDIFALTPRQWEAAAIDFGASIGYDRTDPRVLREARALAQCIAALKSGRVRDVVAAPTCPDRPS